VKSGVGNAGVVGRGYYNDMLMDLLYVDKHDSSLTNDWKYYRVTPIAQVHIEICEVTWPTFADKGVPIQSPFVVGLKAAERINEDVLRGKGILQDRAILIGLRVRD
jgi:hypothetical protein